MPLSALTTRPVFIAASLPVRVNVPGSAVNVLVFCRPDALPVRANAPLSAVSTLAFWIPASLPVRVNVPVLAAITSAPRNPAA